MKSRKEELLSRLRNTLAIAGIEHLMDSQSVLQPTIGSSAGSTAAKPSSQPAVPMRSESPARWFGWSEQPDSRSDQQYSETGRSAAHFFTGSSPAQSAGMRPMPLGSTFGTAVGGLPELRTADDEDAFLYGSSSSAAPSSSARATSAALRTSRQQQRHSGAETFHAAAGEARPFHQQSDAYRHDEKTLNKSSSDVGLNKPRDGSFWGDGGVQGSKGAESSAGSVDRPDFGRFGLSDFSAGMLKDVIKLVGGDGGITANIPLDRAGTIKAEISQQGGFSETKQGGSYPTRPDGWLQKLEGHAPKHEGYGLTQGAVKQEDFAAKYSSYASKMQGYAREDFDSNKLISGRDVSTTATAGQSTESTSQNVESADHWSRQKPNADSRPVVLDSDSSSQRGFSAWPQEGGSTAVPIGTEKQSATELSATIDKIMKTIGFDPALAQLMQQRIGHDSEDVSLRRGDALNAMERQQSDTEAKRRHEEEEAEAKMKREEEEVKVKWQREQAEATTRKRAEDEAERRRVQDEAERRRVQEEAARRRQQDADSKRRQEDTLRRMHEEAARMRQEEEAASEVEQQKRRTTGTTGGSAAAFPAAATAKLKREEESMRGELAAARARDERERAESEEYVDTVSRKILVELEKLRQQKERRVLGSGGGGAAAGSATPVSSSAAEAACSIAAVATHKHSETIAEEVDVFSDFEDEMGGMGGRSGSGRLSPPLTNQLVVKSGSLFVPQPPLTAVNRDAQIAMSNFPPALGTASAYLGFSAGLGFSVQSDFTSAGYLGQHTGFSTHPGSSGSVLASQSSFQPEFSRDAQRYGEFGPRAGPQPLEPRGIRDSAWDRSTEEFLRKLQAPPPSGAVGAGTSGAPVRKTNDDHGARVSAERRMSPERSPSANRPLSAREREIRSRERSREWSSNRSPRPRLRGNRSKDGSPPHQVNRSRGDQSPNMRQSPVRENRSPISAGRGIPPKERSPLARSIDLSSTNSSSIVPPKGHQSRGDSRDSTPMTGLDDRSVKFISTERSAAGLPNRNESQIASSRPELLRSEISKGSSLEPNRPDSRDSALARAANSARSPSQDCRSMSREGVGRREGGVGVREGGVAAKEEPEMNAAAKAMEVEMLKKNREEMVTNIALLQKGIENLGRAKESLLRRPLLPPGSDPGVAGSGGTVAERATMIVENGRMAEELAAHLREVMAAHRELLDKLGKLGVVVEDEGGEAGAGAGGEERRVVKMTEEGRAKSTGAAVDSATKSSQAEGRKVKMVSSSRPVPGSKPATVQTDNARSTRSRSLEIAESSTQKKKKKKRRRSSSGSDNGASRSRSNSRGRQRQVSDRKERKLSGDSRKRSESTERSHPKHLDARAASYRSPVPEASTPRKKKKSDYGADNTSDVAPKGSKVVGTPRGGDVEKRLASTEGSGGVVGVGRGLVIEEVRLKEAFGMAVAMYLGAEVFYDGGNHWCRKCSGVYPDVLALCSHLHSDQHQLKLDPDYNKPRPSSNQKMPPVPPGTPTAPARGNEFIMPLQSFFCSLCCEFCKNSEHMQEHLTSVPHNDKFKIFLKENPAYEMQYLKDKMISIINLSSAHPISTAVPSPLTPTVTGPNKNSNKNDPLPSQQKTTAKPGTVSVPQASRGSLELELSPPVAAVQEKRNVSIDSTKRKKPTIPVAVDNAPEGSEIKRVKLSKPDMGTPGKLGSGVTGEEPKNIQVKVVAGQTTKFVSMQKNAVDLPVSRPPGMTKMDFLSSPVGGPLKSLTESRNAAAVMPAFLPKSISPKRGRNVFAGAERQRSPEHNQSNSPADQSLSPSRKGSSGGKSGVAVKNDDSRRGSESPSRLPPGWRPVALCDDNRRTFGPRRVATLRDPVFLPRAYASKGGREILPKTKAGGRCSSSPPGGERRKRARSSSRGDSPQSRRESPQRGRHDDFPRGWRGDRHSPRGGAPWSGPDRGFGRGLAGKWRSDAPGRWNITPWRGSERSTSRSPSRGAKRGSGSPTRRKGSRGGRSGSPRRASPPRGGNKDSNRTGGGRCTPPPRNPRGPRTPPPGEFRGPSTPPLRGVGRWGASRQSSSPRNSASPRRGGSDTRRVIPCPGGPEGVKGASTRSNKASSERTGAEATPVLEIPLPSLSKWERSPPPRASRWETNESEKKKSEKEEGEAAKGSGGSGGDAGGAEVEKSAMEISLDKLSSEFVEGFRGKLTGIGVSGGSGPQTASLAVGAGTDPAVSKGAYTFPILGATPGTSTPASRTITLNLKSPTTPTPPPQGATSTGGAAPAAGASNPLSGFKSFVPYRARVPLRAGLPRGPRPALPLAGSGQPAAPRGGFKDGR